MYTFQLIKYINLQYSVKSFSLHNPTTDNGENHYNQNANSAVE